MKNTQKIFAGILNLSGIPSSAQVAFNQSIGIQSQVRLAISIAASVFVCEALVMFVLSYLPIFPTWFHALLDAFLLVVLLSPVLYFGLFRSLVQHLSELRRAEEVIKKQRDNLDNMVHARTADLSAVNAMLKREIDERARLEDELENQVEARTAELAQVNEKLKEQINERIRVQGQIEQSKAMLQAIFDGIPDPLVLMAADMKVKMVNRAAADYYGIGQPQDILKGSCHQVLKGSLSTCKGCEVPGAIISGKSMMFERTGFMDPDRLEHVFVYPVKGKDGQGEDVLLRISDITEQRLFEKHLIQSEKLASLGVLVSSIAHEINNPNSFISFNLPILKDYFNEIMPIVDTYAETHPNLEIGHLAYPEFRKDISNLLDNIAHGSERISSFVSNLKEFSQVKDKIAEEWIDLNSVIEKVLSICGVQLKKKVNSFITNIPENPPRIWSDPYALEQILLNLLVNAVQAAEKKDSRVELSVEVRDSWLDHTKLEIKDNGRGIDQKAMQKIFDPFFTTKSGAGGTGLGLYVTHNLVQSLRGRIDVDSTPGKGSAFRVFLPDRERRQHPRT